MISNFSGMINKNEQDGFWLNRFTYFQEKN